MALRISDIALRIGDPAIRIYDLAIGTGNFAGDTNGRAGCTGDITGRTIGSSGRARRFVVHERDPARRTGRGVTRPRDAASDPGASAPRTVGIA